MVRLLSTNVKQTIMARLEPGEDILNIVESIVRDLGINGGHLTCIGAVSSATLGYFDRKAQVYRSFTIDEDLEVVSCMGNITRLGNGDPVVHAHMIVADDAGKCYGGHLMPGCEVSVTIEVVIDVFEGEVLRAKDELTGLNLLDLK